MTKARDIISDMLAEAGVTIDGHERHDLQVHDERFYDRVIADGSLGLGESYLDGWWDVEQLDEFFYKIFRAKLDRRHSVHGKSLLVRLQAWLLNMQSKHRSQRVAHKHYDLGNEFYQDMLDPSMSYTCAYWEHAQSLGHAQQDKYELICRKLQLKPSDQLLDLGCGWGGFAIHAAERYGCHVTAYNISTEQIRYAKQRAGDLPIEFKLADYREVRGSYDKISSIGMFEHVGPKNYANAVSLIAQRLSEDGLFLLHTIGRDGSASYVDPWIDRYIFPGGVVPSMSQLSAAIDDKFVIEHFQNFGEFYDRTLMAWHANFIQHWHRHNRKLDERFYRMWSYYLQSCAGSFRARRLHLWQWVLSKRGLVGGYRFIAP